MPNILQPTTDIRIQFVVSPALDLVNAMYFTSLAGQFEGVDDWPVQTRPLLEPALRDELDFLFSYPGGEPGIMGALNDTLFFHPDAWPTVEALVTFVRSLPDSGEGTPERSGIQSLALHATRWPTWSERTPNRSTPAPSDPTARDAIRTAAARGGMDVEQVLTLYDDPAQVRERIVRLIERFYEEHYGPDEPRRIECMRRSVARHEAERVTDVDALLRRVTGRDVSCIAEEPEDYRRFVFVPSLDVGAYNSCADLPPVHGLYYACEREFAGDADEEERTRRMAMVYKALADEQRLRILRLLRDGELYAQQIVERTGLHQSVVSRHLMFLKAVGLVNVRRQNNMKFFSLNTEMRGELTQAVDAFLGATR